MTEEEKMTNQAAADQEQEKKDDKEASKTKLEFNLPEANRVVMPKEDFKEQPDYLKVFANFYIAKFDSDDLEIINLYDKKHNMVDINKYLLNNINFPRKTLIDHALQYHDFNFLSLIDEITKEADIDPKNMKTFEDWDAWYEKRRAQIPGSLS